MLVKGWWEQIDFGMLSFSPVIWWEQIVSFPSPCRSCLLDWRSYNYISSGVVGGEEHKLCTTK